MTRADKIRAMNDKDLTVFLADIGACETCVFNLKNRCSGRCVNGIYKYLQQEVDDDK